MTLSAEAHPKKRESRDDPDHHNELVPGEVSPHSSSTPFFLLRPLDVLSFIDVQQVFLLLEFSLGVNHKKKLWRKKSNKIRQSTCGQTPLYMDIGSGFFIFEKKKRRWSLDWQDVNDLCLDFGNYDGLNEGEVAWEFKRSLRKK